MDANFFEKKLKNHTIFEHLKKSLSKKSDRLRNLIELRDDVFYAWDSNENCLLCVNLKHLEENEGAEAFQKLHLHQAPSFDVERLLIGACGSRICVWGDRGATVVELPSRWGRAGLFDGGKDTVLCKSYSLDERFLFTQGEVRRVRWHPSSLSHMLVLLSDNTIRIYNIALKSGPKHLRTLVVGPKPSSVLAGRPVLESLGDTAVDFDTIKDDRILVLRGGGDLYSVSCSLEDVGPHPAKVTGPLTMYPPADDNYGEESCSLAVLAYEPAVVVIATCSAVLYHCLLLPDNENSSECDLALYVTESVELNISLNPNEEVQHSYPVDLYPVPGRCGSYVCVHRGGLHSVAVSIVSALREYLSTPEEDIESSLSSLVSGVSRARYLLHTGAGATATAGCGGLALAGGGGGGAVLLALMHGGEIVVRHLEQYDLEEQLYKELQMKQPALEQDDINNILKEREKLQFSTQVRTLLARTVSQPLLHSSLSPREPRETLEFLSQATLKLRSEYMSRQLRAAETIQKKVNSLKSLSAQQDAWYNDLQKEINDVSLEHAVLREKLHIAEKNQEEIKEQCSSIIRRLRGSLPVSTEELSMLRELERVADTRDLYARQIQRLKDRADEKKESLEKRCEEYQKKNIALGKSHSDTISSILQQQTTQVSTIIGEAKKLKEQLAIV